MLDSLTLLRAMNGIHREDVVMAGKSYFERSKSRNTRKIIHITLLAAVLISLLTAGAYAASFLGLKAIVIPEATIEVSEIPVPAAQSQAVPEDTAGEAPGAVPEPQEADEKTERKTLVSITQPQEVPEELDNGIKAKVENARAAWAEWQTWRRTSPTIPHEPQVFVPPKGTTISNYEDNEDGTFTISFYGEDAFALIYDQESGIPDFSAAAPLEVRTATAEEMAEKESWMEYVNLSYGDYDFNYDIHNEAEAAEFIDRRIVPACDVPPDTAADMVGKQLPAEAVQCAGHRGYLDQDIRAVCVFLDHPLQAAHLALDPFQPGEQRPLFLFRPVRMRMDAGPAAFSGILRQRCLCARGATGLLPHIILMRHRLLHITVMVPIIPSPGISRRTVYTPWG